MYEKMKIERNVWEKCKYDLTCVDTAKSPKRQRPHLEALASIRALIVNPSTNNETISHVLETLAQFLQQDQQPLRHHVIKLLSDISYNSDLSHIIFRSLLAYALAHKDSSHLTAEALAAVVMIAEQNQSSSSASTVSELKEDFFLSLCSSPFVSVRSWLIFNASNFNIRPFVLATVLLEFTKDNYPYVRRDALRGLVNISKLVNINESKLIERCYDRAVELLLDNNDCVRSMAIDVVKKWGQMLATSDNEIGEADWSDAVFVQLCSVARDMSLEVRTNAFVSLGKIKLVSEDILLQTLTKKVHGGIKERKVVGQCATKEYAIPASNVSGVFIHGLEDEFYEVRRSACESLGMLTIFSGRFANEALNLLTDLLNDDVMTVRLQSLEAMYHMATCDRLKVQGMDMDRFLGTLLDACSLIRRAARNILRLMKLTDKGMFKWSISALLTSLESHPEDEADIFCVLFAIGRGHGNFTVSFVGEVSQEIEPSCGGELPLDKARIAAILVLAIAVLFSDEQYHYSIPRRTYSYALPFLGRISRSLIAVIGQDTLLAYLLKFSKFLHSPTVESLSEDEHHIAVVEEGIPNPNSNATNSFIASLAQINSGTSEIPSLGDLRDPRNTISVNEFQQKQTSMHEEVKSVGLILEIVSESWPSIKSGCMNEVQRTLRSCKEELATIAVDSYGSSGVLAFGSLYIRVIQLLAKVWGHFLPSRKFHGSGIDVLDLLLEKLDMNLKRLQYGFLGLTSEEELHILDIVLLTCVLRLSKADISSQLTILKRLHAIISRVELLSQNGFAQLPNFPTELKKTCQEAASYYKSSYYPFPFKKLLELFSLKRVIFSGRFKHISVELNVPGNNSESPLPFISGLPVGIAFQVTLQNVSGEDRIWLKMAVEERTQYVFLDINQFEDHEGIRKLTFCVPFYRTPKSASFLLRASIGKECQYKDVYLTNSQGGPKHELAFLCDEKEIYLVRRC